MSVFAYARRGAQVGMCVLALGAAGAAAQQAPVDAAGTAAQPTSGEAETVKPAESQGTQTEAPTPATSNLPELVVDAPNAKKEKKKAKANQPAYSPPATAEAAPTEAPPANVTLGGAAASDTGLTTFDAGAVKIRSNPGGDANTFMRNLPNVQYQNNAASDGGASSQKTIDTKPQLLSISGGRTYENNFILNGVSINNIAGSVERTANPGDTTAAADYFSVAGQSPQSIYVPTEFVGEATIIDSNASAEYGQFQGGVVMYDLAAPPTDRYRASVSAGRETSDTANYILATPDGTNPNNRQAPQYVKNNLAVSVGAPITKDFSFIAQASRKEAESSKQMALQISNAFTEEDSDNIFMRFAATVRTDIGKFTLDTSRTDYYQNWESAYGRNLYLDTETEGTSTKLEHEAALAGVRVDGIGLGGVKVKSRLHYNTSETQNLSGGNIQYQWAKQLFRPYNTVTNSWDQLYKTSLDWCQGVDPATYASTNTTRQIICREGGFGDRLTSQTDFGFNSVVSGNLLLGSFKAGTEVIQYQGRRARLQDTWSAAAQSVIVETPGASPDLVYAGTSVNGASVPNGYRFKCAAGDTLCTPEQIIRSYQLLSKYDDRETVNALHTFFEIDQTWEWLNVRPGVRVEYDDYFDNINVSPRFVGTITPFKGVSVTGGFNRYYLGESLYYALRDKDSLGVTYSRAGTGYTVSSADGALIPTGFSPLAVGANFVNRMGDLDTPYKDEFSGAIGVVDPVLGGQWRFRYLERYGKDQFATESCGTTCLTVSNNGTNFYRSASAEYTKAWDGLQNSINLNAAALTGSFTWSQQRSSQNNYLYSSDVNGDGGLDNPIWYNEQSYGRGQFNVVTGNLDIPVRFGATLATLWFDGVLELNASAGINLGYTGVYDTGGDEPHPVVPGGPDVTHDRYNPYKFGTSLRLDVSGKINVTEQASIQFFAQNLTSSGQQVIVTNDNPWVLGRSFWVGTGLKF